MLLPLLEDCGLSVLLATLDFLVLVLFTVLFDPLDNPLFVLLTRHKHMLVLSFDSVHEFLEENLFLLALGHENVPNYICKLLVVVELSEKDVLLRLIFALFKSHWVESIDKETFYRKDQEFTQMLVANYLLKNISIAAVLGLLKNVFKRALGKVPLFLLRVRSLRIFNLLKEFIRLRYTKDLSEAGTEAARTFVVNTIDNFFENSGFYLLFL